MEIIDVSKIFQTRDTSLLFDQIFAENCMKDKINWTEREKDASANGNSVNNVNTRTIEFPQHCQG